MKNLTSLACNRGKVKQFPTGRYMKYNLRKRAVTEVDVVRRSESKQNINRVSVQRASQR